MWIGNNTIVNYYIGTGMHGFMTYSYANSEYKIFGVTVTM